MLISKKNYRLIAIDLSKKTKKTPTVAGADNNTKVAFKNCAPFRKCRTEINETFIDEAEHINIAMPMYNLIEYSDNYSDTSGSLWQFKGDEIEGNVDLTVDN